MTGIDEFYKKFPHRYSIKTVCTVLVIMTSLCILLFYAQWSWIRISLILTLITYLSSHAIMWPAKEEGAFDARFELPGLVGFYVFLFMPFVFSLLYPGHVELELSSDPKIGMCMMIVSFVQGIGFWFIVLKLTSTLPPKNGLHQK